MPAVLCKNHGPFTWGKNAHDAVHNAVVIKKKLQDGVRFLRTVNPRFSQTLGNFKDKHYFRKHGANAYYGQNV